MISIDLSKQRVIVTGASTGIGRSIATRFAEAGADVAIQYVKNKDEAEETAKLVRGTGSNAVVVRGDFRRPDEIRRAMTEAITRQKAIALIFHVFMLAFLEQDLNSLLRHERKHDKRTERISPAQTHAVAHQHRNKKNHRQI